MTTNGVNTEEFFQPLDADRLEVTEVESLCVNCTEQGTTKLMLTKIPFFRDVIISSFDCPHCHYHNSELGSALEISSSGVEFILQVKELQDLNRVVVKSDYTAVTIPELELEIPQKTQKGEVTTVEGILNRVTTGLSQDQERRKEEHPEAFGQIQAYLQRINDCLSLKTAFTVKLHDISGNSFIGHRPDVVIIAEDPLLTSRRFARNRAEDAVLGLEEMPLLEEEEEEKVDEEAAQANNYKDEVLQIATSCPECGEACFTKMKVTDIPFFKEVIIMATDCDKCGARTNEVKSGGGIEAKGKKITLKVKSKEDFSRDVLKSDTCYIRIPELELEAGSGAIVGKFTTIEGLLLDIKKQLSGDNPLIGGDSVDPTMKDKMVNFCKELDNLLSGEREFTIVLDDPAGNCYVQNVYAPEDDPEMTIEDYERTFDQNEELGLNDVNLGEQ